MPDFKGTVTTVLPVSDEEHSQFPSGVEWERTSAGTVFNTDAQCKWLAIFEMLCSVLMTNFLISRGPILPQGVYLARRQIV